ncbi:LysR family transcriptional regulator [Oricola sp.]|uniref:LysR family transcriptional regulator n=1 Tax=Oricola sp. TaxID=1979950 RepID=UPI0025ECBBB6|nr:LysR family transcriptional regulator [Oricola sp.]MCI5076689.1 LysR family transcriptional regulator [Oricola sp.]
MKAPAQTPVEAGGLTIKNMRTFFWLARLRNYHATAKQLGVTQPAVTSRIASLEDELGVRLFSRDRQVVTLTPEGQDALRLCEGVLERVDDIVMRFSGTAEQAGVVRIGVVDTVARTWLPALLNRVQAEFPNIVLEITNESTVELHSMLRSGGLSMSITIAPCDEVDVANTQIGRYAVEWVGSGELVDGDRVYSVEDLTRLPLIGYLANSPPMQLMQRYFKDAIPPGVVRNTTNSMSTMIWLAENGLGIAAIPPQAILQHLRDRRLVIIKAERRFDPMPFYLNCRVRPYSPVVQTVEALVRQEAARFAATQSDGQGTSS